MTAVEQVRLKMDHRLFEGVDFSGENLAGKDLSHSRFIRCKFDDADMSEALCEFSDFDGSTFINTNCNFTSFKRSTLQNCVFRPRDAYGCTFTCSCKTFQNMKVGQLWWYSFALYLTMTVPDKFPNKEDLVDKAIAMIGADRYTKLKALFASRQF